MEHMGGATLICFPPQLLIFTQMAKFEMSAVFDRRVNPPPGFPIILSTFQSQTTLLYFFSKCKGDQMSLY